ncbi:MAG: helix-turn-helix transcriptional regulator [Microthrixaceae bacterium]
MSDTTTRTLRLLSLLQRRRFWAGAELSERLGVSERTLRRDVHRIRSLGYDVDSEPGIGGGYRLGHSEGETVLLIDDDEAVALATALHKAAAGSSELAEASLGALTKVMAMLNSDQRRRVERVRNVTTPGATAAEEHPSPTLLDTVAAACRDKVRLGFTYTAADGQRSERYVEPHNLVVLEARWYLVAWDDLRSDWRTFRLDRVEDPTAARNSFTPRALPTGDLEAMVRFDLHERRQRHQVVIDIAAPAEQLRAEYGAWATIDALGPDSSRLTMTTDTFRWPTYILANTDVPVRVVGPPEFTRHLRTVGESLRSAIEP